MGQKKRRLHPLVIALIVLVSLMLILCVTVLGLWFHGRSSINREVDAPELPPREEETEESSENLVVYQGKRYRYNENMRNILLMGIDSDENPDEAAGSHDQADVLVLAALDLAANQMTLISISRDTMCDIQVLNQNGELARLLNTQLALSYAYGDGQQLSCEMTRDAVSNLFYGLPIQGYAAYYMNGIATLNDAVGGVTVTILDDFLRTWYPSRYKLYAGCEVTLDSELASLYVRNRLETQVDANQLRMQRQKQYMLALISQAKETVLNNPASILTLYDAVDDYIITNLDIGEISYLATAAAGMDFAGDLRSLTGELVLSEENYAELYLDQDALFKLMLDVFYTEVNEEGLADQPTDTASEEADTAS